MNRILIVLSILLWSSCASNYTSTRNTVKDINDVISISSTSYDTLNNWEKYRYYTGEGMRQKKINDRASFIEFSVQIDKPAQYKLFVLAATMQSASKKGQFGVTAKERNLNEYASETNTKDRFISTIDFSIAKKEGKFSLVEKVPFNLSINPQSWLSNSSLHEGAATINFSSKGIYKLRVEMPLEAKTYIDRIVLSRGDYIPTGTGPEDSYLYEKSIHTAGFDSLVVLPPHWAFGVLYGGYTDQAQTMYVVNKLIKADYPIDAYWIDSWFWDYSNKGKGPQGYMSFKEDKSAFPSVKKMWDYFESNHVKGGIWVWDCIMREGNEQMYDDFNKKKFFAHRFIETNRWHNKTGQTICGNIDFENEDAVAHWQQQLKPFFDQGLDFLKLDRSSEIAFCKSAFEATQNLGKETKGRGFIMAHLHTTFDKRHKSYPTKWTGDAKITWTQPNYPNLGIYAMGGYKENIEMIADPKRSTYEVPFLTHDAGGYDYFKSNDASDELYIRWIQFASLNSVMTIFSQHYNETRNHPINYSPSTQKIVRKYLKLRMQLFPYIYTYALNTRILGKKMVQGDCVNEQQYLFGDELLVAPVYVQGANSRDLYLPEGKWYDLDTDELYDGDRRINIYSPIEKMPVFVREGAIIPMRDYARSIEQGTNKKLTLHFYPTSKESTFTLLEDDGASNEYLDGVFASTKISAIYRSESTSITIAKQDGSYKGAFLERDWDLVIHSANFPENITVNGVETRDFSFDNEKSLLVVKLKSQATTKDIKVSIN